MVYNIFKGLGIALVTPFKQDGSVDYEALLRLVEYQLDNGADFFRRRHLAFPLEDLRIPLRQDTAVEDTFSGLFGNFQTGAVHFFQILRIINKIGCKEKCIYILIRHTLKLFPD